LIYGVIDLDGSSGTNLRLLDEVEALVIDLDGRTAKREPEAQLHD
jgi:hypothetical protein